MIDDFANGFTVGIASGLLVAGCVGLLYEIRKTRESIRKELKQQQFRKVLEDHSIDPLYYGNVAITYRSNEVVCITSQDDDHRILKVLWEREPDGANCSKQTARSLDREHERNRRDSRPTYMCTPQASREPDAGT